ncbi:hypothetical protein QR98_0093620 [Sarcoptes scabiei]|uniref:Uncharacterized protein n=1 Tax=Sarcoptes scabiei TaxID=52283 RepID=A0A132AJ04_SARSC|nr:hypothetical protein QR98_0093620 [Sarcoptes scabiei]
MSRAWEQMEQLRTRIEKIDDLWKKEQQHCFTEMAKYSNNSECHPSEITECIANKNFCREPIVFVKTKRHTKKGYHHIQ